MTTNTRNNSIDILRLIACISVIFLHIQYGHANEMLVIQLRLLARWAVPFFFLTSGFFFQKGIEKAPSKTFQKTFYKILFIALVADIAYFPIKNFPTVWHYLLQGNSIHLWFLHSMLLGIAVVYLLHLLKVGLYISMLIALIILSLILLTGSYSGSIGLNSPDLESNTRTLLSIPLMLAGTYFYNNKFFSKLLRIRWGVFFFIVGVALQIVEAQLISVHLGRSMMDDQFLTGTIFLSIGIFILANTIKLNNELIGFWGINYSLFIYIYHPRWIFLLKTIHYNSLLNNALILILPFIIFSATLFTGILLDKYLHRIFLVATGSVKEALKKNNKLN
jgi:surface polysaccharide O-acyltransferase-like enzyme